MEIILIICAIAWSAIQIIMVVKFFQIASDVRKLKNDKTVELSQRTIDYIGDMLTSKLKARETTKVVPQKIITTPEVKIRPIPAPEHCTEAQRDDQLENEVLGYILSNDTGRARHLLMTKKGMTLNQAIEYISRIETEQFSDSKS